MIVPGWSALFRVPLLVAALLVAGCGPSPTVDTDSSPTPTAVPTGMPTDKSGDGDGDGHAAIENGGDDCDDSNASISPAATEVCDGIDNNCDGVVDLDATDQTVYYRDADEDGYGDDAAPASSCSAPEGYVSDGTDCDDGNAGVFPGNPEVCDGLDNNCDGTVDEGVTTRYFADSDADGHGNPASAIDACQAPAGYVANSDDCDDADAANYPGNEEVCDARDNDCDTLADELLPTTAYHPDADGDGYGAIGSVVQSCSQPTGYVADGTDCDDADVQDNPGNKETCDGRDNDCTGIADDGAGCPCPLKYYLGRPYLFCATARTWADARDQCHTLGYHLLTIDDAAENTWANSTASIYSSSFWWTGLNDIDQEGVFQWEDGSALAYTNWLSGEPNNSQGNEDCVETHKGTNADQWNDEDCAVPIFYVCETY